MSTIRVFFPRRTLGSYKRSLLQSELYLSLRDSYRTRCASCHSPFENIYHCCTQRTASQWLRGIFDDARFVKYTGLRTIPYTELGLRYADLHLPFQTRSVVAHLYVSYPTFECLPKPEHFFAFFILRDPRDVVTSWYFAARYSHRLVWPINEMREVLAHLNVTDGFNYVIDQLDAFGTFEAQRSWVVHATGETPILRYEKIAADNVAFLTDLFCRMHINMSEPEFRALCEAHSFTTKTHGRQQGEVDDNSHYRVGIAGDYQNHFTPAIMAHFRQVTGDTLEALGYQ